MSDTADFLASKETADAPRFDASPEPPSPSPPSYNYQEQQPPPYSADPDMYPPSKEEPTFASKPTNDDPSVSDMNPDTMPDTTEPVEPSPFEDKTVRRAFVRKVFSIVTIMLLVTFSVVCVFTFSSVVKEAVKHNLWAYLSSFFIFLIVAIPLSCCQSFSRRHPWNIVGLVLVTLSMSYMVGTVASFHDTAAVVITIGVTLAICFAIIAFSAQTRYDFTACTGVLMILALDLVLFGIICSFYYSHVAQIAYGCLGALLFALFLMIDVQLLTGTMSNRVDPEDYVTAALIIYLDIIIIFLYLLGKK
ncbi:protein lifeguard 1 [Notolabrus celidotus]|uniref:protein lifeguard 1 n=1 Tax=Notolabrus celidotus TaxID=1203425 RepID=UPI00148FB224|nr:protein lifeguard 1 [Notolabrus celidotus]